MPTYEYACSSCGNQMEVTQSFSEDPLTECEVCGGPLRRVFHTVGVLFKGSGFYSTDNRSKRSPSSKKDKKEDSSKSSDSDTKSSKETSKGAKAEEKSA